MKKTAEKDMADTILEVRNLKKTFTRENTVFTAVDHVSFSLKRGECLGIVGESGSGKSTVARIVTRLLESEEGEILLLGKDITKAKGRELRMAYRNMQMVFQMPTESFDPRRTLGQGIGESLRNAGVSRKEAEKRSKELMELCGLLQDYYDRYPHQVSGGQCQRAAIARALAVDPVLLICDEATSALDVTVQSQILELLRRLKKERQLSFLFICHDLALVQEFCDRVLVMYQGKIVEEGTPDKIINEPEEEYTRQLVEAADFL